MKFESLHQGSFQTRLNRFSAMVLVKGQETRVYVPNTGRMAELFQPGRKCFLTYRPSIHRKTSYDLVLIELDSGVGINLGSQSNVVCTDSRISPLLVWESVCEEAFPEFYGYQSCSREVVFMDSRLDLVLLRPNGKFFIEVKSVNLVRNGTALFPDAPTVRGRRHLGALVEAVKQGYRSAMVFVVQRNDADKFSVNQSQDPDFGIAIQWAATQGVEIYAYKCRITSTDIKIVARIPLC